MIMKKKVGMVQKWKTVVKQVFETAAKEREDCTALSAVWNKLQIQGEIYFTNYFMMLQCVRNF